MMKVKTIRKPSAVKEVHFHRVDGVTYVNLKVNRDLNTLPKEELDKIACYILQVYQEVCV